MTVLLPCTLDRAQPALAKIAPLGKPSASYFYRTMSYEITLTKAKLYQCTPSLVHEPHAKQGTIATGVCQFTSEPLSKSPYERTEAWDNPRSALHCLEVVSLCSQPLGILVKG